MNAKEAALAIMKADMATGRATQQSLGVMYAFVMAGDSSADSDFLGPINRAVMAYAESKASTKDQFRFLEGVKKVAWRIIEEAARAKAKESPSDERDGCEGRSPEPVHHTPGETHERYEAGAGLYRQRRQDY